MGHSVVGYLFKDYFFCNTDHKPSWKTSCLCDLVGIYMMYKPWYGFKNKKQLGLFKEKTGPGHLQTYRSIYLSNIAEISINQSSSCPHWKAVLEVWALGANCPEAARHGTRMDTIAGEEIFFRQPPPQKKNTKKKIQQHH